MAVHVLRLAHGPAVTETLARCPTRGAIEKSAQKILNSFGEAFHHSTTKASSPQPIRESLRAAGRVLPSAHVDEAVRRRGGRDRRRSHGG